MQSVNQGIITVLGTKFGIPEDIGQGIVTAVVNGEFPGLSVDY